MIRHLVIGAINASDILLKFIEYPIKELFPFLDYIQMFMAIHILFGLLALVPKFEPEPLLGS